MKIETPEAMALRLYPRPIMGMGLGEGDGLELSAAERAIRARDGQIAAALEAEARKWGHPADEAWVKFLRSFAAQLRGGT